MGYSMLTYGMEYHNRFTTPQPFYGSFFRDHLGEVVPEETSGLYGARED